MKDSIFGNYAQPLPSKDLISGSIPGGNGFDTDGINMDFLSDSIGGDGGNDITKLLASLGGGGGEGIFGGLGKGLGAGYDKLGGAAGLADILGGISGIFGAYNGGKQLNLAEDAFDFQKAAYNTNLANQAKTINNELGDQNRARQGRQGILEGDTGYVNREDYLAKRGVSGKAI